MTSSKRSGWRLPGPHHTLVRRWHHDPRWRLFVSFVIGAGGVWLADHFWGLDYAFLAGWVVVALLYCLITGIAVWRMNPRETAAHAMAESPGNVAVHLMLLGAAGASLIGLVVFLAQQRASPVQQAIITASVVVASWAVIQVIYALRYARKYYETGGGIDFNQPEPPEYTDFAYLAFTIGMTFQVSDNVFSSSAFRRIALGHAILTYVFGTVFLASVINILASLGT